MIPINSVLDQLNRLNIISGKKSKSEEMCPGENTSPMEAS